MMLKRSKIDNHTFYVQKFRDVEKELETIVTRLEQTIEISHGPYTLIPTMTLTWAMQKLINLHASMKQSHA